MLVDVSVFREEAEVVGFVGWSPTWLISSKRDHLEVPFDAGGWARETGLGTRMPPSNPCRCLCES